MSEIEMIDKQIVFLLTLRKNRCSLLLEEPIEDLNSYLEKLGNLSIYPDFIKEIYPSILKSCESEY